MNKIHFWYPVIHRNLEKLWYNSEYAKLGWIIFFEAQTKQYTWNRHLINCVCRPSYYQSSKYLHPAIGAYRNLALPDTKCNAFFLCKTQSLSYLVAKFSINTCWHVQSWQYKIQISIFKIEIIHSISSQVSNCDGVVLEIYSDHKFQWPQEGLNYESLA